MKIEIEKIDMRKTFVIPQALVDDFLLGTKGEYIKLYLYIIRNNIEEIDITNMAKKLDMLGIDILHALKFWESKNILKISKEDEGIEEDKEFIKELVKKDEEIKNKEIKVDSEKNEDSKELLGGEMSEIKNSIDMEKLNRDKQFVTLLFITEKYLNKALTHTDIQRLAYLYDYLKMSYELLEYIIEEAVSNDKKNLRYIETVAIKWHEEGIETVQMAKKSKRIYSNRVVVVMNAFGMKDTRNLIKAEMEYIDKWFVKYAFSDEIVAEACKRTIIGSRGANFKYADKILTEWFENKLRNLEEINKFEEEKKKKNRGKTKNIYKDKFHMFTQRDEEIDEQAIYDRIL